MDNLGYTRLTFRISVESFNRANMATRGRQDLGTCCVQACFIVCVYVIAAYVALDRNMSVPPIRGNI